MDAKKTVSQLRQVLNENGYGVYNHTINDVLIAEGLRQFEDEDGEIDMKQLREVLEAEKGTQKFEDMESISLNDLDKTKLKQRKPRTTPKVSG